MLSNFRVIIKECFFTVQGGIAAGQQIKVINTGTHVIKQGVATTQPGMSGIQALAAAAAATSKINTPGTTASITQQAGQAIKLIQQPGGTLMTQQGLKVNAGQTAVIGGQPVRIATASPGPQGTVIKTTTLNAAGKPQIILQKPGGAGHPQVSLLISIIF